MAIGGVGSQERGQFVHRILDVLQAAPAEHTKDGSVYVAMHSSAVRLA